MEKFMKKRFGVFSLVAIILCSCFMFFGCGKEPNKYNVRATVWYANYGSVEGSGTYEEDSTCTLVASPKQNSTFLAWMKDNLVVSYDKEYSFKVSNETSGNYVAIFTLPSLDLVTPKSVGFKTTLSNITSYNLELKVGSSYDYLHILYSGAVTNEGQYGFPNIVLALPVNNKIICEANLTLAYSTEIEGEQTETSTTTKTYFELQLEELSSGELELRVPTGFVGDSKITLLFENFNVTPTPQEEPETNE